MSFSQPVQCSDDVPEQTVPFCQTGLEVSSSQTGEEVTSPDIQADANLMPQNSRQHASVAEGASVKDRIELTEGKSKIEVTNLLGALQPGTNFLLANKATTNIVSGTSWNQRRQRRRKYRLTDSQEEPDIRHLDVISAGLAEDWCSLGRHFELLDSVLEQIRMDYQNEGQHEINYRMLVKWKQEKYPVTVHMLAKALDKIGRGDLADELCKG